MSRGRSRIPRPHFENHRCDMNSLWKLERPYKAVMIALKIYALGIKKRSLLPGYDLLLEEHYACITLLQTGPWAQTEKQFPAQISFSFLRMKKKM